MKFSLSQSTRQTAKNTLVEALTVLINALDGLPIPGAKASATSVLQLIKAVDVSKSYASLAKNSRSQLTQSM
jgi:hypothetical protein